MTITNTLTQAAITLDVLNVDYIHEARSTRHPVEFGVAVTDHVEVQPAVIRALCFVTETPTEIGAVGGKAAIEQVRLFFELNHGATCRLLIPGEGSFINYVLEAFRHAYTNERGRGFDLRFVQVRIAVSQSIVITPRQPAPVASTGAPSPQSGGQQATTPPPSPESALSVLGSLFGL